MSRRHDIALRVTAHGYEPYDSVGWKQHAKLQEGSLVSARIARGRSVRQNAMYWKVLTIVVERAPGRWRTPEALHMALKVACGITETLALTDGRRILVPGSTSFDDLTQDEFNAFSDAALQIVCDEIMDGASVEEILSGEAQAA